MQHAPATIEELPRWRDRLPASQLWTGADLSTPVWNAPVPDEVCAEVLVLAEARPELLRDPAAAPLPPALSALGRWAAALRRERLDACGVARIARPAHPRLRAPHRRLLFAQLGRALGDPLLRYGLLYEVRDRGGSYEEEAIPVSQTASATGLHTDSSAVDCEPEYVGLLCEQPSAGGGESVVSNGVAAHEHLRVTAPEALLALYAPLVRDLVTPGIEKTPENRLANRFPVFADRGGARPFLMRYMRYWIERGHERVGEPLPAGTAAALDALDSALAAPGVQLTFRLEAGEALWLDNQRLAHGRQAYERVPSGGRCLWRMWLTRRRS